MANEAAHIALANRTQATINYLCADAAQFAPWIATCAFYKALHLIEAAFSRDVDIGHTSDHGSRFETLKKTVAYEQIYRSYCKLARAANIARYLEDRTYGEASCFEDVYSSSVLTTRLLLTDLAHIEASVASRLSNSMAVAGISQIKPIIEQSTAAKTT